MRASRLILSVMACVGAGGALTGCNVKECGCVVERGTPKVSLGAQTGPVAVNATYPNPCEIDVDFGALKSGQTSTAMVQLDNIGAGELLVGPLGPTPAAGFAVSDGSSLSVEPGGYTPFNVSFSPSTVGTVSSWFVIPTDGFNSECPDAPDGGHVDYVTVKLVGVGG